MKNKEHTASIGDGRMIGSIGVYRCWGYKIGYLVKKRGFFYWKDVLGEGFNKRIFRGVSQYLVKLRVLFNIPQMWVIFYYVPLEEISA